MSRLTVALRILAILMTGLLFHCCSRPAPVPVAAVREAVRIAPDELAVIRKGELVYVPFRVRAVIPHGKGLILEVQPVKVRKPAPPTGSKEEK